MTICLDDNSLLQESVLGFSVWFSFPNLMLWFQISKECFLLGDMCENSTERWIQKKIRTKLPYVFSSLAFTWINFFVVIFIYRRGGALLALAIYLSSHSLSLVSSSFLQDPCSPILISGCSSLKLQRLSRVSVLRIPAHPDVYKYLTVMLHCFQMILWARGPDKEIKSANVFTDDKYLLLYSRT